MVLPLESTFLRISPMRYSSTGAETSAVDCPFRVEARSYAKKKNALLRPSKTLGIKMGPPTLPPGFHCRTIGRLDGVKVNPRALKTSLRLNTKALPCTVLVPDLVTQLMTPFEVRPYSAEYPELCTLNSSMPSTLTPFMA